MSDILGGIYRKDTSDSRNEGKWSVRAQLHSPYTGAAAGLGARARTSLSWGKGDVSRTRGLQEHPQNASRRPFEDQLPRDAEISEDDDSL
jgi:hypothetical protein